MRDLVTAMTLGWAAGAIWWFGVAQPRRTLYENFYKNYDAKAVAANMKASFEGKASLLNWWHVFTTMHVFTTSPFFPAE